MKDLLLINFFSKNESGYVEHYLKKIEENHLSYDSIYFERYSKDTVAKENEILFKEYCPTGGSRVKKIGIMSRYASLVRKAADPKKYRGIIVFTTVPSIMLMDILTKKFDGRYILDIRDYTHESISLYKKMVGKIVKHSFRTVISSKGFLSFLPPSDKYTVVHNIGKGFREAEKARGFGRKPVNIGFVGSIRYYKENVKLLEQMKNDPDYRLVYYGTTTLDCDLKSYCEEHGVRNAEFFGKYRNSEKDAIYQNIDLVNSVYGTESTETVTLTPNRLYDAALYKIPIVASKGTFLAQLIENYGLGCSVDLDKENLPEKLNAYIKDFSAKEFTESCGKFLADVREEMTEFENAVGAFAQSLKRS